MNTTMLLLLCIPLLATGVVAAVDNCSIPNTLIENCCNVSSTSFFTFGRNIKASSGVYWLSNFCGENCLNAEAYCDTNNGGGGWLVVQRRKDGSVDFNRTWVEYENGFGKLTGEFWYGLKALHCLTGQGGWEMRMDIKLANGTNIILQYEQFKVASAIDKYKLTVGGFQGITTDPMAYHNAMKFTTKDNDNDSYRPRNCALFYGPTKPNGGWWHNGCWNINPNNFYNHHEGINLNSKWITLSYNEIKIRPYKCYM